MPEDLLHDIMCLASCVVWIIPFDAEEVIQAVQTLLKYSREELKTASRYVHISLTKDNSY
jgi:hypothetical protein